MRDRLVTSWHARASRRGEQVTNAVTSANVSAHVTKGSTPTLELSVAVFSAVYVPISRAVGFFTREIAIKIGSEVPILVAVLQSEKRVRGNQVLFLCFHKNTFR